MFSFNDRKKRMELCKSVQRLINLKSPNLPPVEGGARCENRYNRTIPALLVPAEGGKPVVVEPTYTITKDLSDKGVTFVLNQPCLAEQVVCGFWLDSPIFLLGKVRHNVPLGAGFWQLGVELTERLSTDSRSDLEGLVQMAARLDPAGEAVLGRD